MTNFLPNIFNKIFGQNVKFGGKMRLLGHFEQNRSEKRSEVCPILLLSGCTFWSTFFTPIFLHHFLNQIFLHEIFYKKFQKFVSEFQNLV